MKFIYILAIVLTGTLSLFAQNEVDIFTKNFVLLATKTYVKCDIDGNIKTKKDVNSKDIPDEAELEQGYKFRVIKIVNESYVIRFLTFSDPYDATNTNSDKSGRSRIYNKNESGEQQYFIIAQKDFAFYAMPAKPLTSFSVGVPFMPLKLRFAGPATDSLGTDKRYFMAEQGVSLGASLGIRFEFYRNRHREVTGAVNIIGGASLSIITTDSSTTNGFIKKTTTCAGISPHFGAVFEIMRIQFGVYIGWDVLIGEVGEKWVYRNSPWLGFGVGYNLFNTKGTSNGNAGSGGGSSNIKTRSTTPKVEKKTN